MTGQTTARAAGGESFTAIHEVDIWAQSGGWSSGEFDATVKLCIAFSDAYNYAPVLLNPGETKNLATNVGVVEVSLNKAGNKATVYNQESTATSVLFIGVA